MSGEGNLASGGSPDVRLACGWQHLSHRRGTTGQLLGGYACIHVEMPFWFLHVHFGRSGWKGTPVFSRKQWQKKRRSSSGSQVARLAMNPWADMRACLVSLFGGVLATKREKHRKAYQTPRLFSAAVKRRFIGPLWFEVKRNKRIGILPTAASKKRTSGNHENKQRQDGRTDGREEQT
jgi:hypothetical protein